MNQIVKRLISVLLVLTMTAAAFPAQAVDTLAYAESQSNTAKTLQTVQTAETDSDVETYASNTVTLSASMSAQTVELSDSENAVETLSALSETADESGEEHSGLPSAVTDTDTDPDIPSAPEDGFLASGTCGSNLEWTLTSVGTLTIVGSGEMEHYDVQHAPWYENRSRLERVIIQSGVTSIGCGAFQDCAQLTDVVIPSSVFEIGENAFAIETRNSSYSWRDVYYFGAKTQWDVVAGNQIPYSTKHYITNNGVCGENLIWALDSASKLTILGTGAMSNYITSISTHGSSVSAPWSQLTYSSVSIKHGVTTIGASAFAYSKATSFSLPDTLESINSDAFAFNSKLSSISLPEGITLLDANAFEWCTNLRSVSISEGITQIKSGTFNECRNLSSVTIPKSVTTIAWGAFKSCDNLSTVTYMGSESQWKRISIDSSNTCLGKAKKSYFVFAEGVFGAEIDNLRWGVDNGGTLTISGTGRMEDFQSDTQPWSPWSDNWIYFVKVEEGVENIGEYALQGIRRGINLALPISINSIGKGAFSGCERVIIHYVGNMAQWEKIQINLETDELDQVGIYLREGLPNAFGGAGDNVTWVLSDGTLKISGNGPMMNDPVWSDKSSEIQYVEIEDSITSIGNAAFRWCENLREIVIPDSVENIGESAFYDCDNLRTVTLPEHLTRIEKDVFSGCRNLTEITIPESVQTIGEGAFSRCESLTAVTLPKHLKSIENRAFSGCRNLTGITIPSSIENISAGVFSYCISLRNITLPENLTNISAHMFNGCSSLEEITIPESVTSIGQYAFCYCTNLTAVTLPENLNNIENLTFADCLALTEIVIPDSVESIGAQAFSGCDHLSGVTIPYSVDNIAADAFSNCGMLILYVADGSYAENYAIEHNIPYQYALVQSNITLTVSDSDGSPLSDGYTVRWYEGNGTIPVSAGNVLRGVQEDHSYEYEIILGDDLFLQYYQPERTAIENVSESKFACTLTARPVVTVSGRVTDTNENPLSGTSVTFAQTIDSQHTNNIKTQTGDDGVFSAAILADTETKLSISLYAYYPVTENRAFNGESENLGTIALSPLPANKITLSMTKREAVLPGGQPPVSLLNSADNLQFTLYNVTQGREITDFTVQYPEIVFADGQADGGDNILISSTDHSGNKRADDVMITLDEYRTGNASLSFVANGFVQAEISGKKTVAAFIFDQDGVLAGRAVSDKQIIKSPALPDGDYTLILTEKSSALPTVSSLESLSELGLTPESDYKQSKISVNSGVITDLGTLTVPELNESKLFHTVAANTFISTSARSAAAGRYISVRVQYELESQYDASDELIFVEIPDGLTFVENSVSKDSKSCPYTFDGRILTVMTGKKAGTIRLYVLTTETGDHTISAFLRFASGGDTFTQPVGSSVIEVSAATLSVPEKTGRKQIVISGKTIGQSAVKVLDNNQVMAETTANKGGSWSVDTPLLNPADNSLHKIHAEITTPGGVTYSTGTGALTYHKDYCEVERVTMHNTAHGDGNLAVLEFVTVFEFLQPDTSKHAYNYWPKYPDFTFVVEMTGEAEKVQVITTDQNGDPTAVDCVYDEASGNWIGTRRYTSYSTVPAGVSVSFTQKAQRGTTEITGESVSADAGTDQHFRRNQEQSPETPSASMMFTVDRVFPATGGSDSVTVCVSGKLLEPNAVVTLTNGTDTCTAQSVTWLNHEKLYAAFDLSAAPAGTYSLRVSCGDHSGVLPDCFTLDPMLARGELSYDIHISDTVTAGNVYSGYVTATNIGYTDVSAPVLALMGANLFLGDAGEDGKTPGNADNGTLSVFLQNRNGLAGTLAHGETAGCEFSYRAPENGKFGLRLVDYSNINNAISSDSEAGSDAARYAEFNKKLLAVMGETYPTFAVNAAKMADALDPVLDNITLDAIISGYLQNLTGFGDESRSENVTDLASSNLVVSRVYTGPALTDSSSNLGLFGMGWAFPYEITAACTSSDDAEFITITSADSVYLYMKNGNGVFVNILNDADTARRMENGTIAVTRQSGESLTFNPDGKLISDTDIYGNAVTLSYTGGVLNGVQSSDGDAIQFVYNTDGTIASAHSETTGDTVSYAYTNQFLTSVSTKYGVTRYAYNDAGELNRVDYPDGIYTQYSYDNTGRAAQTTDGDLTVYYTYGLYEITARDNMGNHIRSHYDTLGNVIWSIDTQNRVSYAQYNDNSLLESVTQGLTYGVSYEYNDAGLPVKINLPDGNVNEYSYDAFGNITGITDANGNVTIYERDENGGATAIRYPDGGAETYTHDAKGRVTTATTRGGVTLTYAYDESGNITGIEYSTGGRLSYSYDRFSNITSITENGEITTLNYNDNGDLIQVIYPDGKTVSYAYDDLGRRISVTDHDGYTTGYEYNGQGLLSAVTDGTNALIRYAWNPDGTLARQDNGNGTYTVYAYENGELSAIDNYNPNGDVISFFHYVYNNLGYIQSMTENAGTWRYGYDALGQLIRAVSPNGSVTEYAYDAAGNRTSVKTDGVETVYTANHLNQYTSFGDIAREYDADGNLIKETGPDGTAEYQWDYQGRLVKYTAANGDVYEYGYDAFGLRNRVTVNGETTSYLNDPTGYGYALASYSGDTATHYALAGRIAAARIDGAAYYYHANHLGSVTEITGDSGAVANQYTYNQEGDVLSRVENIVNPYTYVGVYGIVNDGNGLIYDRARYISAETDSFISPDPAGQAFDLNAYRILNNNAIQCVDLSGLKVLEFIEKLKTGYDATKSTVGVVKATKEGDVTNMALNFLGLFSLLSPAPIESVMNEFYVKPVNKSVESANNQQKNFWKELDNYGSKNIRNYSPSGYGSSESHFYPFGKPRKLPWKNERINNDLSIRLAYNADNYYRFPDGSILDVPLPGIDDGSSTSTTSSATPKNDPSGYVYGGAVSNRIDGVTATIYYEGYPLDDFGEPDTDAGLQTLEWTDAEEYDEVNPQETDVLGRYGWDVLPGKWRVRFMKDGYNEFWTDWMEVPPEYTDVNINLQTQSAPTVKSADAYPEGVRIEFDQYMEIDSVNDKSVTVTANGAAVSGDFAPVNAEANYEETDWYASVFRFTPSQSLSGEIAIAVRNVKNYAGIAMESEYSATSNVVPRPETLSAAENIVAEHYGEKVIAVQILPADAGMNRTIQACSSSPSIFSLESESVTTDSSGKAYLKINGNLPGSGELFISLDGTELQASAWVTVSPLVMDTCADVTASVINGSTVAKGETVRLTTATENATIYYTLDGSNPFENNHRQIYNGPITLTENTRIRAYAAKEDYEDSAEAAFTFRLDTRTLGGVTFTRCADNTIETSGTPDNEATICAAAYTNDGIMLHIEKISGYETLNPEGDAAYYRFYAIDNNLRPLGNVTTMWMT